MPGGYKESTFRDEREILYKVLFDLRKDVTDLKTQVSNLTKSTQNIHSQPVSIIAPSETISSVPSGIKPSTITVNDIQDTEVYVEETLSLDEVEKDMIRRALAKHGGKRKDAAADLNISERTLYRKIKEYNLE
jgi:transcriptional regulator with PAS, ATPase and Fis domain